EVDPLAPHRLAVSLRGYERFETDVKFEGIAGPQRVQAVLKQVVCTLEIASTPAGAEVIVNDRVRGTTPAIVADLPPEDDLRLELRLAGYKAAHPLVKCGGAKKVPCTSPLEGGRAQRLRYSAIP